MKRSVLLAPVVAGLLAVTACSSSGGTSGSGASSSSAAVPALSSLKGRQLVISTWGGDWTAAVKKYFTDPFEKATGVKVVFDVNPSGVKQPALLQVQQHNVQIDLIDSANQAPLQQANALEAFPASLKATLTAASGPNDVNDYVWGGYGVTATVIACNPKIVKKCPTNAKEFFDVKDFPGPRAIAAVPETSLAFALFANGLASGGEIKSMDIDKAIQDLEQIKPDVQVWPSTDGQMEQILTDGQVGIGYLWAPHVFSAMKTMPSLVVNWGDSTDEVEDDGWAVPKGAPNADVAFAFLNWLAGQPKLQAAWSDAMVSPTPTKDLASLVSPATAAKLPDASKTTAISTTWVAAHTAQLQKAWQQFLSG